MLYSVKQINKLYIWFAVGVKVCREAMPFPVRKSPEISSGFFFFAGRETKTFRFGAVRKNMRLTCVNTLANSY